MLRTETLYLFSCTRRLFVYTFRLARVSRVSVERILNALLHLVANTHVQKSTYYSGCFRLTTAI